MRSRAGFTIIELMIVVAIIAIVAAIAIPNLVSARVTANETAALSVMRTISTAQAQFQSAAEVDVDGDGAGEYGFFRELSGALGVRTVGDGTSVGAALDPANLSGTFRVIGSAGTVTRSGYVYRLWLPASGGSAVGETPGGAFTGAVDADLAETTWGVQAWPANYAVTGTRSFFVNQSGDIVSTDEPAYTGAGTGFLAGSAMRGPGVLSSLTGEVAVGTFGRDANLWRLVN